MGWQKQCSQDFYDQYDVPICDRTNQAAIWLQMSIAAELLIISARAPFYMCKSISASIALSVSVMIGCILTSILAGAFNYFGTFKMT